ncbi:hypothetical protein EFE42_05870 [Methanohalophilus sp. RSK]|uniref:hypothetical protein n=1 Tax=Methanohalophilus sp. RSK TaxID=2485783 RepID=UPI000F43E173|nr:hypothetical protein [Methanohalophilus sp. RSK]RNI14133.1 hypothetical protein EFE42_05870 [Methanohalophilus sp. RSK]
MELKFKKVPWEASLLFIGWIWLGWSVFGMTLVNMYLPEPILDIYHLIVGVIYMLPMSLIVFKVFNSRNVAGLPLIICSCVIAFLAIISHSKLNLGVENEFNFLQGIAFMLLTVLLVAMPVSFYIYARSIGCNNTRNLKIILFFSAINGLVLVYNELVVSHGVNSELIAVLMLSFLFVMGPILGGLYIWEVISKSS